MTTYTKAVPSKLQLDGRWLNHATRPFPRAVIVAKVSQKEPAP
jgi:hypothetical protein